MGNAVEKLHYSLSDYLQLEQETGEKHEYYFGEVFSMAGGSIYHSLLSNNAAREISNALIKKKKSCTTYNSDLKIAISKHRYVYPDTFVVCGKIETFDEMPQAVKNPTLIVETLSPSTALYDREGKFMAYRKIKSFREYVLISQDEIVVDVFFKQEHSDFWQFRSYSSLSDTIKFQSIDIEVSVADLYLGWEAPNTTVLDI